MRTLQAESLFDDPHESGHRCKCNTLALCPQEATTNVPLLRRLSAFFFLGLRAHGGDQFGNLDAKLAHL